MFLSCSSVSYAERYDWTGLYGGLNIGFGFQARDNTFSSFRDPDLIPIVILDDIIKFNLGPEGVIGGLQIGFNHQIDGLVLGLEVDFQGSDMYDSGSGSDAGTLGPITYSRVIMAKSSMDAFGTLRGRLGFSNGPLLAYATFGLLYGHIQNSIDAVDIAGGIFTGRFLYSGSEDEWKVGTVVGAGLE